MLNYTSAKELTAKICREFTQLHRKKTQLIQLKIEDLNRHLSKDLHTASRYVKRGSISLVIRESKPQGVITSHLVAWPSTTDKT